METDTVMGVPVIQAVISGVAHRMFFDTGAQISYFQHESIKEYPDSRESH